jgi:hypothetical protein
VASLSWRGRSGRTRAERLPPDPGFRRSSGPRALDPLHVSHPGDTQGARPLCGGRRLVRGLAQRPAPGRQRPPRRDGAGRGSRALPGGLSDPRDRLAAGGNTVVLHLSSFHGGLRFARPMNAMDVGPIPIRSACRAAGVTFVAAGALLAAAFGFGVIHAMRRTGSSLVLAAMAGSRGPAGHRREPADAVRLSLSPARLADERHLGCWRRPSQSCW